MFLLLSFLFEVSTRGNTDEFNYKVLGELV